MSDSASPASLSGKFQLALDVRANLSTGTVSVSSGLPQLISLLRECSELISRLSLFSANESAEDIASSEIQYFLVDAYLAEAIFKQNASMPVDRRQVVLSARILWERFLHLLDAYDLLAKQDIKLWDHYREARENRKDFDLAGPIGGSTAARREIKINRFREEKRLKQQLDTLRQHPRLASDDSLVRQLHLASLGLAVHETWQHLDYCALELQMLAMALASAPAHNAQSSPIDERDRRQPVQNAYSDRLDLSLSSSNTTGPILDASGKPLRPFTLLDKRIKLQDGVFRPDHNLPTMTIDEYLAEEKRRGGIIDGGGPQSAQRLAIDEDDYDKDDDETMKQRSWDDFKDDNPRGSGNTINRG